MPLRPRRHSVQQRHFQRTGRVNALSGDFFAMEAVFFRAG
jgi:hypothetical protein